MESEDDLEELLEQHRNRPSLVEERSHPNHWFNRASDLRASAGAVWSAMGSDKAAVDHLGLGAGFSMSVACMPVYHMLCGLALELVMKARLVQLGVSAKDLETHCLDKLAGRLQVQASPEELAILRFYEACAVWAGRYPAPVKPTDQKLLGFYELAGDVLTEPVPEVQGIQLRRGNGATDWVNFHGLWNKYADLFERRPS